MFQAVWQLVQQKRDMLFGFALEWNSKMREKLHALALLILLSASGSDVIAQAAPHGNRAGRGQARQMRQARIAARASRQQRVAQRLRIRQGDLSKVGGANARRNRNRDIAVENDETHWVGHDRSRTSIRRQNQNRTETVDKNETIYARKKTGAGSN